MDWQPGEFLDADKRWILCSIHGAAYEPADGRCVGGPCGRGRLTPVRVEERDGQVYWYPSRDIRPVPFDAPAPAKARHEHARRPAPAEPAGRRRAAAAAAAPQRAGLEQHARARSRATAARAAQRAPLAHLLPPGLAGPGAGRGLGAACRSASAPTAPSTPHTALVEVRGEIAADTEASAENLVAALKQRLRGRAARRPWCCASTRPAAARCRRHRQRRDPAPEGAAQARRSTRWSRRSAPRAPTTSPWRPTRSTSTRPASWAASAC